MKKNENLTTEEKANIEILNNNINSILNGFDEVLREHGINLHVYSFTLDESKNKNLNNIKCCGCSCVNPPPHYAIPCSLCG